MAKRRYKGRIAAAIKRHTGNWISVGLLAVVAASSSFAQPADHNPLYPDVWGLDLPVARNGVSLSCRIPSVSLYALPNGDLRFLGLYRENTRTEDCQDGEAVFFFVDFFKQSIEFVAEDVFEEFSRQNRAYRITPSILKQKLETSSGVILNSSWHPTPRGSECRPLVDGWVQLTDAKGAIIDYRYLLQILDPPIRKHFPAGICEQDEVPEMEFEIRVIGHYLNLFQLPDKTFLAWGYKLPVALRFTVDLEMKYRAGIDLRWVGKDILPTPYMLISTESHDDLLRRLLNATRK